MVILGTKPLPSSFVCKVSDPYGISGAPEMLKPMFDLKLSSLKNFGTVFDYKIALEAPVIKEYVAITEALPEQIRPEVMSQLDKGVAVEGKVGEIFVKPKDNQPNSDLYEAMSTAANYIDSNAILNNTVFKESAGYIQENWRALDKIAMTVRIEKRMKGKYRVLFKGIPLSKIAARLAGAASNTNVVHQRAHLGSEKTAFLDGGFARTGGAGYGGMKRILLTTAENFKGGMKIQAVGTIIDLVGDAKDVYFDENGSKDLSEFIGRAGVTLVEAGASAVIGSFLSAVIAALVSTMIGSVAVPVLAGVAIAVLGYIVAAAIVGIIDNQFNIKENVAGWAR